MSRNTQNTITDGRAFILATNTGKKSATMKRKLEKDAKDTHVHDTKLKNKFSLVLAKLEDGKWKSVCKETLTLLERPMASKFHIECLLTQTQA